VTATSAAIEVRNLWKVFGAASADDAISRARAGESRADILAATGMTVGVRDVSFAVAPGETFVVMGLSGSGKSTLIRCLSRLIEPTRGEVRIEGDDLLAMDDDALRAVRRGRMAMVFQHFGLFPHRRVIDNIAYGLEVQGVDRAARLARAEEVLHVVGLDGWAHHYPQQLSGGMQQRVGLARALAVDPSILLFDEPFSALDPLIRHEMQQELLRLQRRMQRAIVFITHDFAEALTLGDRIAIMKDGSFDQVGTLAHELGHAFHNECAYQAGKTELQQATPMTLAETASIMCETIATEAALAETTDRDEVLAILEAQMNNASQVVVDIYSRYLFEKEVFERRAKSELSADEINDIMERAQKATFGDGLDEKYLQKYMWTWKPHYYSAGFSFYNYPYTFGLLFATGLYAIYKKRGAEFVPAYKELLATTGEANAADLADKFGINIRTKKFWADSLAIIGKRVDRFCEL